MSFIDIRFDSNAHHVPQRLIDRLVDDLPEAFAPIIGTHADEVIVEARPQSPLSDNLPQVEIRVSAKWKPDRSEEQLDELRTGLLEALRALLTKDFPDFVESRSVSLTLDLVNRRRGWV